MTPTLLQEILLARRPLTEEELRVFATDPHVCDLKCLVCCAEGRFVTRLEEVRRFVTILEREGTNPVRGVFVFTPERLEGLHLHDTVSALL